MADSLCTVVVFFSCVCVLLLMQRYYHLSCRDMTFVTNEEELEVKLKVARCYVQLDSNHEAIKVVG